MIADALIAVGEGKSFRDAADRMRRAGRRYIPGGGTLVSRDGGTIHRYLDHFGELVLAELEPKEWPEVLVLDALPLRKRDVVEDDPFSYEISGNGAVLVAYGYVGPFPRRRRRRRNEEGELEEEPRKSRPKLRPKAWKIAVAGGVDRYSWESFLASLPGTPKWIVADGEGAIRIGAALRWGSGPGAPVIYSCEGHLQNKFRERAIEQDGLSGFEVWRLWPVHDRNNPDAPPGPLWTRDDYRRFLDQILTYAPDQVLNTTSWIRHHDRVIREQFDLRDAFPGMPRGTGALEGGLDKIRSWLGTRTRRFQNVRRMNVMFGLMRANLAGDADPAHYSRIIRDELARTNGRPQFDWGKHLLAFPVKSRQLNSVGSLYRLSDDAQGTTESQRNAYLVSAQASTMARKIASLNAYQFTIGARQLELTKAKAPMVQLKGLKLRDFPTFLDEWDPANPGDPYELSAGHG
ncbi:MAG TPA: hypothetical protein VNL94_00755 [Candidatus Binatia bacterium]|nr:hypothetical protein [Candidatus Binatia bacterium]